MDRADTAMVTQGSGYTGKTVAGVGLPDEFTACCSANSPKPVGGGSVSLPGKEARP